MPPCLRFRISWRPRSSASSTSRAACSVETNFDDEVRKIRFELGAAQETITDQDTINVQLTSDLFNTKGLQEGLKKQLKEAEEEYEQKLQDLEQKSNKLRNQIDDYEYKLSNKDEAIAALMNELANRGETIESVDEVESAIQEIEERRQAGGDSRNLRRFPGR